jgi:CheY-like chemotaxis protein
MADDDEDDCTLAKEAFEESGSRGSLLCVEDGVALFDFLRDSGKLRNENNTLPALILLDLNMPRKDGRQVLAEMKNCPEFQEIPIVVLSTSQDRRDVEFSLGMGARSFLTKPVAFADWIGLMRSLADEWLEK